MPWIVAVTESRREKVAKHFIELQGRIAYVPMFREWNSEIVKPLFPGYIFVQYADGIWRFLLSTIGVIKVLRTGDKPELMHDGVMNNLRKKEKDGVICINEFQEGDEVYISGNNVFSGWNGIYLGMSSHVRCRIMLSLLGQQVPVDIEARYLKAAGDGSVG